MLIFFTNLNFMDFLTRCSTFFLCFFVIACFVIHAGFPRYPTYLQLHIDDLPDHAFCNIAIYADDTTVYVNVTGF